MAIRKNKKFRTSKFDWFQLRTEKIFLFYSKNSVLVPKIAFYFTIGAYEQSPVPVHEQPIWKKKFHFRSELLTLTLGPNFGLNLSLDLGPRPELWP